jgi:hypothetical protein
MLLAKESTSKDVGVHAVGLFADPENVYPGLHSNLQFKAVAPAEYCELLTLSAGHPTGLHVVAVLT